MAEVRFWHPLKNVLSCDFFIIRECDSTLYVELQYALIQNSSRYFSRLKWAYHKQTLTSTDDHISCLISHLWVQLSARIPFLLPDKNRKFLRFFIINIRECSSTLCVGMAHPALPTNTHFQITFLLTRLLKSLFDDLPV